MSGSAIPVVLVSASASSGNDGIYEAGARGDLSYYFILTANPGFGIDVANVPILLNGNSGASLSGTGGSYSNSNVYMNVTTVDGLTTLFSLPTNPNGSYNNSYGASFTIAPNVEYYVQMGAYVGVGAGGAASAYIDPMFTIDPSFQYANDFSFTFSPGIGNATGPIPLPGAPSPTPGAGLVGLGFLALTLAAARRQQGSDIAL